MLKREIMPDSNTSLHFIAIDCCEHTLAALRLIPAARLTAVSSRGEPSLNLDEPEDKIDLMIIGFATYPVRRVFISQLRRIYPAVPVLILRREESREGEAATRVRGEFVLSDQRGGQDCQVVEELRQVLPLKLCEHAHKNPNYDTVREVIRLIVENYTNPHLSLERVARDLAISPLRLSRILNKQVGVSFRQLLRHTRIEEAKRLLASHHYSVKEVAARVGFTDSHYFSRSFKQITGLSASGFRAQDAVFN